MVGIAIEGVGLAIGPNSNPDSPLSAEQLKRMLLELDRMPESPAEEMVLENDRLSTLDVIQSIAYMPKRAESFIPLIEFHRDLSSSRRTTSFFMPPSLLGYLGYNWNVVMKQTNYHYDHLTDPAYAFPLLLNNPLPWLGINSRSRELSGLFAEIFTDVIGVNQSLFEVDYRNVCCNQIQRIVLAMLLYEQEHGTLPPTFTVDAEGKPLHSWRVLLLPYLGEKELYDNIRLDEPWDSEHNRQYHQKSLTVYRCPSAVYDSKQHGSGNEGGTNYTVIVGDVTPFGSDGKGRLSKDFGPNTIFVAEHRDFIPWMQPDAEVSQTDAESFVAATGQQISSFHSNSSCFGLKSVAVGYLSTGIDLEHFKKLIRGTAKEAWR